MKQAITIDQLNELTDKGKERYWAYSKLKNWRRPDSDYDLWSIGQLIEFLDEYEPDKDELKIYRNKSYLKMENKISWRTDDGVIVTQGSRPGWSIRHFFPNPWYNNDIDIENDELCDALWLAVKEILND